MLTAVMKGHLSAVRQLIELGCDRDARDKINGMLYILL